jgi:hypothetical protein
MLSNNEARSRGSLMGGLAPLSRRFFSSSPMAVQAEFRASVSQMSPLHVRPKPSFG